MPVAFSRLTNLKKGFFDMTIRYADSSDTDKLVYLWQKCFPADSEDYIRFFYERNRDTVKTLCAICGDDLACMINLIPADIVISEASHKAVYGYAIGALPEYRGKGVFLSLHEYLCEWVLKNNMIYVLSPENGRLADYYESHGMRRSCYIKKRDFLVDPDMTVSKEFEISDIDAAEYKALRDAFIGESYVSWDVSALRYAIDEKRFCGGFAKIIRVGGDDIAVLGDVERNAVVITEVTARGEALERIIPNLARYFGKEKISVFSDGASDTDILNGMTVGYDGGGGNIYLNLTLG